MNTIHLAAATPRGEQLINNYGNEWLVVEDRGTRMTLTDLDERYQMTFPNPHVKERTE
jgi:hypothetical protein